MARLNFRHGILRYQTDINDNPTFLQKVGDYVNLIVSSDPTIFTISHFDQDYLFVENTSVTSAWGPFVAGTDYYLYWDVDLITGAITRGYTTSSFTVSATAPSPSVNKHWYDSMNRIMKVWSGSSWVEKLRVFAAFLQNGATLIPYPLGTQVGIENTIVHAGYPLFDSVGPIQRFRRDRRGVFIHTETPLSSQWSKIANYRLENTIRQAEATEHIPQYFAVSQQGPNIIGLASSGPVGSPLILTSRPAIGIAAEDMYTGEVRTFITSGYVENELWGWDVYDTQPAGTPLFVGLGGALTTSPPQLWSIQRIGTIVDETTIFLDVQPIILYG